MATLPRREVDLSAFPSGTVTEFTTLVCLACIFDIFTKQLGLAPRTAFSEVKRHTPTIEELTSRNAARPYFDSGETRPHCPYCGSAQRWLARFDTYCIEGSRITDGPRRALIKKLPTAGEQFVIVDKKSDSRAVFFEWLDTLRVNLDFTGESWLLDAVRSYLQRREPKTNWHEIFSPIQAVRRSTRLTTGWEVDGVRLFLAPSLYAEALLIQYLVSRSHAHGGLTLDGRLTLIDLIRRLRYFGYLDQIAISERDPGEIFERVVDHLASAQDWSSVRAAGVTDKFKAAAKPAKKSSQKTARSSKGKKNAAELEVVISQSVKLHYIIDRRDFLEKVRTVYAAYA